MTCIAFDGRTLAADKASSSSGYRRTVTKLFQLPDGGAVAFTGDGDHALALLEWFKDGRKAADWPAAQKDGNGATAFYVDPAATLWLYDKTPHPQMCEDRFDAGGSGRDYALAAMHLGKTAREAVEVAIQFDANCGNGVDSWTCP